MDSFGARTAKKGLKCTYIYVKNNENDNGRNEEREPWGNLAITKVTD